VKDCFRGTHGEPSVNLLVFERMLAEQSRVRLVQQHALAAVELGPFHGGRRRILAARFAPVTTPPALSAADSELRLAASVFIDTSYEGDLMAMAGENYHVGRESRSQYGEPLAGDERGGADAQVQGYNFRFVMTTVAENRRMPAAPEGYRRDDFAGVLAHFSSGKLTKVFASGHDGIYRAHLPRLPNGKADVNDTPHAPARLSMPDINDGYPEGDAATRAEIVQAHRYYNVGLLYFLQNDDAVPTAIREEARQWGWCRDEFTETGGIPPQLYIREARRLVGQHVFTASDTQTAANDARAVLRADSIAIGDYVHNCHGTGRVGTRFDGRHTGEFYHPVPPYQIPYGAIVPAKTENLLVPVACSASHFGFSALRLEPIWCSLGQAAGWAAHLAVEHRTAVQSIGIAELQTRLHGDGLATIYLADVPPGSPAFAAAQWLGTAGGFHGLVDPSSRPLPRPEFLGGQYNAAFPGHSAELDKPLDPALEKRWRALAIDSGVAGAKLPAADGRATRGQYLQAVFEQRSPRPMP
jgi:hypothetical protein